VGRFWKSTLLGKVQNIKDGNVAAGAFIAPATSRRPRDPSVVEQQDDGAAHRRSRWTLGAGWRALPHDAGNVPLGQERIAVFMVIPVDEEPIDNPGGLRQPRVEIDKLRHAPDGHRAGEGADRMSPIRPAFAGLFRRLI
jgi:hypothetical protein